MKQCDVIIDKNDRLVVIASIFLFVSSLAFLSWGYFSKLDSASVASGVVMVETKRKSIQHLEGGIVSDVYIKEGQRVEVGTPLVKISDISYLSRLKKTKLNWISYDLQYQRLVAEREQQKQFLPLMDKEKYRGLLPEVRSLISNQQSLFNSRVDMREKEVAILVARLEQAINRRATTAQKLAKKEQAATFLAAEISMHEKLLRGGYTSKSKVLELKRSEVLLQSDIIAVQTDLSDIDSSITELSQQTQAVEERNRSDIESEIAQVKNYLVDLESQLETAEDIQSRTIVKSPSNGIVLGLKVNASGEVINPGEIIMEIVPDHDELVIEALIKPTDIDEVHVGQKALVRLSAFNYRTTPTVQGEVIYIDADRAMTPEGNQISPANQVTSSGYRIKVKVREEDLKKNADIELYPGMPAEVYVLIKERRPIDYLLEPITDSLFRAFRES